MQEEKIEDFSMSKQMEIDSSAHHALTELIKVTLLDNVLILTDVHCKTIADGFEHACLQIKSKVETHLLDESKRPLKEPPDDLVKLLDGKSIVLNILKAYPEEIPFRIKWIFKVEENKNVKMGHMPGITERMMLGSVNVNYKEMSSRADALINLLDDASQFHIITEEGTDLILGVSGRTFIGDVGVKPGEMCNLPCGEVYCAPLETEADGVVIFNASIGDIGLLKNPLKVYMNRGRITKFESDNKELVRKISELQDIDADAMVIGELGIGINSKAVITGNMLEDEKAIGTAHIAFGNNADFPGGGKNNSKIHRDYLFYRPTIEVKYFNGDKKIIMKKGKMNL